MRVWGCNAPSESPMPGEEPFLYELGDKAPPIHFCPISLMRRPFARISRQLYSHYQKGLTPNGRGSRHETALYNSVMLELSYLEGEAEEWYIKEKTPKNRG